MFNLGKVFLFIGMSKIGYALIFRSLKVYTTKEMFINML